ncbi:MAG: hypothetical protein MJA82_04775 [Clostridia bacterium]|nr:hypothetical protein [Clostridia bacterium]
MGFFDNFFNIFRFRDRKEDNNESNNDIANMKDINVSLGEDPGSLENQEDEKR